VLAYLEAEPWAKAEYALVLMHWAEDERAREAAEELERQVGWTAEDNLRMAHVVAQALLDAHQGED
jgi:hypothetical protein